METIITITYISILLVIGWIDYLNRKHLIKRLNIAENLINDLANQYMILLRIRREGKVITLQPEMALKEREH